MRGRGSDVVHAEHGILAGEIGENDAQRPRLARTDDRDRYGVADRVNTNGANHLTRARDQDPVDLGDAIACTKPRVFRRRAANDVASRLHPGRPSRRPWRPPTTPAASDPSALVVVGSDRTHAERHERRPRGPSSHPTTVAPRPRGSPDDKTSDARPRGGTRQVIRHPEAEAFERLRGKRRRGGSSCKEAVQARRWRRG